VATTKHKAYSAAIASTLTTELNSIANNANTVASAAIDNTTNLDLYHDLTLTIATQGTARVVGASVLVFRVLALDGTNYDDVNQDCAELVATFTLDAAVTARQLSRTDVATTPGLFKYFVRNQTGQTLAASGNILEWRAHSIETA
jgi:hypothetical protein